ncbi:MAG: hypothetical protein WBX25_00825 [Rhodomicrobium sp.]
MTFKPGKSGNPSGLRKDGKKRAKRDKGVAALAAKTTPENIRWLEHVRDSDRAPWAIRMDAVKTLLAYGHEKPRDHLHHSGDAPGQTATVNIYNASISELDTRAVNLPANGYEIDPETRKPLFPELAGLDEDGDEELLLPRRKKSQSEH